MFGGLETVSAPAATQPVVYDSSRLWLAIRRDFVADFTDQVSEAWNRYATSLRIVGRFALAAPLPSRSVRKLAVSRARRPRRRTAQGVTARPPRPSRPAAVEAAPEPAAVEVEPGPRSPGSPAADVTASRLAVAGAAEPRPGSVARPPGRGPGA